MSRSPGNTTTQALSKKTSWLAVAFAVLGLAASSASTWVHHRILNDPTYASFCDVNATVSCTEAYSSRFGSVAGIPVALFGVWFFAFVLCVLMLGSQSTTAAPNLPGYVFALSTVGLAAVLYLAYASFVILKAVCVLCVGTYVAVIGLFLISGAATRYPMTSLPRRVVADLGTLMRSPKALSAVVAFLAASVALSAFFPVPSASVAASSNGEPQLSSPAPAVSAAQVQQLEAYLAQQPRVPIMVPSDGATVVIVKFNDYQCPACGQSYLLYKPVLAKYAGSHPGDVRVVMKDYPLNANCNVGVRTVLHPAACDAAVAVRLARAHNRGEQMEEWLYTHQQEMTPASVRQAAREVGNVTDFDAKYQPTLESVKSDIALGQQLHVTQTPTFFINGIKVDGAWAPQFFDQAIAYELQQKK